MLRTSFCELFAIDAPVLQAPIWPATSPELVAAVSEAGGIGSIGTVFEPADRVRALVGRVRELTERPFVVNHVVPALDEDAFTATLEARPAAVSFALGDPGGLVERVHAAGLKAIQQIHTVGQAREAAALGVDVIVAQGRETGGRGWRPGSGRWRGSRRSSTPSRPSGCSRPAAWPTGAGWRPRWSSARPG